MIGAHKQVASTLIQKSDDYVTEINFFHVDEVDQQDVFSHVKRASETLVDCPGFIAVNVLRSNEGTRICTYLQWRSKALLANAHQAIEAEMNRLLTSGKLRNQPKPRTYSVVYADDRSTQGLSIISFAYTGAIFINEITTQPATQDRLLELVIANNQIQSIHTPGYRSANFHKSDDGERAVNYSLWDSQDHCIEAISKMADMDENLEETVEIANPDFRFYSVAFAAHI